MKIHSLLAGACLFAWRFAPHALALFAPKEPVEPVPVDRLARNAATYLAAHPDDADAHYILGRIHYLAFASRRDEIMAYDSGDKDGGKPEPWRGMTGAGEGANLPKDRMIAHAAKANEELEAAVRMQPGNPLYWLGLASFLEEFSKWEAQAKPEKLPAELRGIPDTRSRDSYFKAFQLALPLAGKSTDPVRPVKPGISTHYLDPQFVLEDAAGALISRYPSDTPALPPEQRAALPQVREVLSRNRGRQIRVTPIVFSSLPAAHLDELLSPETIVDFDLRGLATGEHWPWVKPELGLVVWDPLHTGQIKSARQLFGG